jgi:hypothetical protein
MVSRLHAHLITQGTQEAPVSKHLSRSIQSLASIRDVLFFIHNSF